MAYSHYVPRFILKNFGNKISTYNIKNQKLSTNVKPENVFGEEDFYSSDVENKLNRKIESKFANVFNNKISNIENRITLTRKELKLVKKFLLVSIIRSLGSEDYMLKEKNFYNDLSEKLTVIYKNKGYSNVQTKEIIDRKIPFVEKQISNETIHDYWLRTLEVILDSDGTPLSIMKNDNKTYPAFRWACVVNTAYIGFWDAPKGEEFVITDIGMTSENELGWDGIYNQNHKKLDYVLNLFNQVNTDEQKQYLYGIARNLTYFHENFQMFSISKNRMIVLISPFFKFLKMNKLNYDIANLTNIPDWRLFEPNACNYIEPNECSDEDIFEYKITKLTYAEILYCNSLFLDRINSFVGFSNTDAIRDSLLMYYKLTHTGLTARVNYDELMTIILNGDK